MVEETNEKKVQTPTFKKERFEFVLTINGNIVCQRYFKMPNFKKEVYSSIELIEAIDECVGLIDNDLKFKTNAYLQATCPQIFKNEDEMKKWVGTLSEKTYKLDVPSFVIVEETDKMYVWDGNKMNDYNGAFNYSEYVGKNGTEEPTELKFAFLDYGREMCARVWDGNVYPMFVRTNIDLSNSKNKYKSSADGYVQIAESMLVDRFNDGLEDLIPKIINVITEKCSLEEVIDYTTSDGYDVDGGEDSETVEYDFDIKAQNRKYLKTLEDKKKTALYFRGESK